MFGFSKKEEVYIEYIIVVKNIEYRFFLGKIYFIGNCSVWKNWNYIYKYGVLGF